MKARTEEMLQRRGVADRDVKRGYGGIRDIEFAVQLLQLVHGRADPAVRTANTLHGLEQLARGGYITTTDAAALDDAYVWLRTVEHRLQLVDEQQTHTVPDDVAARTHLARVLGHRDRPGESSVEAFDAEQHRRQAGRARHPRQALLRAGPRHPRRRRRARGRRRADPPRGVRFPRRGTDPGGIARAHRRTHAPLARHAAVAPRRARLAVGRARSRSGLAAATSPHRGVHAFFDARAPLPRDADRGGTDVPCARFVARARDGLVPPSRRGRRPGARRVRRNRVVARRADRCRARRPSTGATTIGRQEGLRRFKRRAAAPGRDPRPLADAPLDISRP